VGNVPQQGALGIQQRFDPLRHAVEIESQQGDLILSPADRRDNADRKIAGGQLPRRGTKLQDGRGQITGQEITMVSGISSSNSSISEMYQQMFSKIDTDSDGSINNSEMR